MAREYSILKLRGRLDGMIFYKNAEGHQVRTIGGIARERIMNDANFVRTRENMQEFGNINRAGKLIRDSIGVFLRRARDLRTGSRLVSVLAKIKNLDGESVRGQRTFAKGFSTAEGKALLVGFDFNKHAPLDMILKKDFELDSVAGDLTIPNFKPRTHLTTPDFATHVNIGLACVRLDAEHQAWETVYSVSAPILTEDTEQTLRVTLPSLPAGTGVKMFYLLTEFFQEVNGELYELKSDQMNALKLVEIV